MFRGVFRGVCLTEWVSRCVFGAVGRARGRGRLLSIERQAPRVSDRSRLAACPGAFGAGTLAGMAPGIVGDAELVFVAPVLCCVMPFAALEREEAHGEYGRT